MAGSVFKVELLGIHDIMGILQIGKVAAYKFIKKLPESAVIRFGRGRKILVHGWAVARVLKMDDRCPGCERPWPAD